MQAMPAWRAAFCKDASAKMRADGEGAMMQESFAERDAVCHAARCDFPDAPPPIFFGATSLIECFASTERADECAMRKITP